MSVSGSKKFCNCKNDITSLIVRTYPTQSMFMVWPKKRFWISSEVHLCNSIAIYLWSWIPMQTSLDSAIDVMIYRHNKFTYTTAFKWHTYRSLSRILIFNVWNAMLHFVLSKHFSLNFFKPFGRGLKKIYGMPLSLNAIKRI